MKRLLLLLVILIAFVSGTALGYLISTTSSRGSTETLKADRCSSQNSTTPILPGHADGSGTKSPAEPDKASQNERPDPSATAHDPMKEVIAKTIVDLPPAGIGQITGVVKLKDGTPLTDVRIKARGYTSYYARWRNGEEPSLEEELTHVIRRKKYSQATLLETVTGTDGTFVLSGASDIDYGIEARLDGYRIITRSQQVRPGARVNFVAEPIVTLLVRLERFDGKPITRGLLVQGREAKKERNSGSTGWYPESPELQFTPGTYYFWGEDQSDKSVSSEVVTLKLEAGIKPAELKLVLKEWPSIAGKVILPDDAGENSWPTVIAVFFGSEATPVKVEPDKIRGKPTTQCDCRSWDDWQFSFPDCEAGNYLVYVKMDNAVVAVANVTVTDKVARQDFLIAGPNRDDFIAVRAFGPDGKLLDDLNFNVEQRSENGSNSGGGPAKKQKDGSYWIQKRQRDDRMGKNARWFLQATSKSCGTREVEFTPDSKDEIVVRFDSPAFMVINVSGATDADLQSRLRITARIADPDGRSRASSAREVKPGTNQYRLGPVEPGLYTIEVCVELDHSQRTLAATDLKVSSGENVADIAVPALYTLSVRMKEAKAGIRISLQTTGERRSWESANTDENGVASFRFLPAGVYSLGSERDRMRVEVRQSATIDFEPQAFNALKISFKDKNSYAATLGFQSDDLIIGANGAEFKSEAQMQAALTSLMEEKTAKLTVQRASSTFEIEADLAKLFKERGTSFEPTPR